MIGLLLLGLICLTAAFVFLLRVVATPRARAAERLEQIQAYGFSAEAVASPLTLPGTEPSAIAGLVSRVGEVIARRFGRVSEADLRDELMAAGLYQTAPRTLLGYRAVLAVMFTAVCILLAAGHAPTPVLMVLVALAAGAGWMTPLVLVRRRARMRLTEIDRTLPELIDMLVVTVEAGLALGASLRVAASEFTGPLHDELALTLQEQSMGLSMSEALTKLLARCDTPAMRSFVRAVTQGEVLGVSTGMIMRGLAVEMRKRRRASAEEQAQRAPIKLLFPLVFLIFPTMFVVLLLPAVFSLESALS
jgi:tight adherence protein C